MYPTVATPPSTGSWYQARAVPRQGPRKWCHSLWRQSVARPSGGRTRWRLSRSFRTPALTMRRKRLSAPPAAPRNLLLTSGCTSMTMNRLISRAVRTTRCGSESTDSTCVLLCCSAVVVLVRVVVKIRVLGHPSQNPRNLHKSPQILRVDPWVD